MRINVYFSRLRSGPNRDRLMPLLVTKPPWKLPSRTLYNYSLIAAIFHLQNNPPKTEYFIRKLRLTFSALNFEEFALLFFFSQKENQLTLISDQQGYTHSFAIFYLKLNGRWLEFVLGVDINKVRTRHMEIYTVQKGG